MPIGSSSAHFFFCRRHGVVPRCISVFVYGLICYFLGAFFFVICLIPGWWVRKEGKTQSCFGDLIGLFCVTAPLCVTVFWKDRCMPSRSKERARSWRHVIAGLSEKASILRVHN